MRSAPLATLAERTARRYRDPVLAGAGITEPPLASLAYGAAGVAYFLLRHASFGGGDASLAAADVWVAQAERPCNREGAFAAQGSPMTVVHGQTSMHYGEPGVLWVRALVDAAGRDGAEMRHSVVRFGEASARGFGAPWDVNWGAAGLLLGCAQLVVSIEDERAVAPVRAAGERLASGLTALVQRDGARAGETTLGYLGAAHGWGGVAHALLRWSRAIDEPPPPEALELLERLIALRRPSGRWPIRAGGREVWRSWCHGSAGWAQLWALAWESTGEERLLELADRCADDAAAAGGDNASLCCGRAGHGFAALTLYRATGERRWLRTAHDVAAGAMRAPLDETALVHQLFSGELGVALLAAELEDPGRAAMPVYQEID